MMNWFYQQTRRDQIAIAICAVVLAIYVLWMFALRPLSRAAENAETRHEATAASLARVKTLAATLQHHQRTASEQPRQQQVSMANLVDRSTSSIGLRATSMDPSADGQSAAVRFDDADLAKVLQWLHDLETNQQVQVEYLSLIAANQPGQVMATVRLNKG
ncbi:type II secretion system protein GspM [Gilvimarinus sp. F26214L]|uniref:type II secretion system protein GspM n=1 Tax=Gilvimarinus sp. DZF01 TaxID=3461371 RepID=UPI0040455022